MYHLVRHHLDSELEPDARRLVPSPRRRLIPSEYRRRHDCGSDAREIVAHDNPDLPPWSRRLTRDTRRHNLLSCSLFSFQRRTPICLSSSRMNQRTVLRLGKVLVLVIGVGGLVQRRFNDHDQFHRRERPTWNTARAVTTGMTRFPRITSGLARH